MVAPPIRLPRFALLATCTALTISLSAAACATTGDTIRIWRIGSPHRGDTPDTTVPIAITRDATRRGFRLSVEAFPAKSFAATFFDAVKRKSAPDVLVFDNFGVMDGITTKLGRFDGIGTEPAVRKDLIRVTDAFDELLGPTRGWTYLFASSANHKAARALALTSPVCPNASSGPELHGELVQVVPTIATAYVKGQSDTLRTYADPDRLPAAPSSRETVRVGVVQPCGVWGNEKLAFAWVNASYEAETTLGHTPVLLVLRKPSSRWQLLAAARDPISNRAFVKEVRSIPALLARERQTRALPVPATLLAPPNGSYPQPSAGERFGTFTWRASPSDDVVVEIAEFAYHDDARLFFTRPARPGLGGQISAGQLWTTRSVWQWRIWSVTSAGNVVFSDVRTFTN